MSSHSRHVVRVVVCRNAFLLYLSAIISCNASCLYPFQYSRIAIPQLQNDGMTTLDARLAARLANDKIPGRQNSFDEPTNALQKRFDISSYGIKGASIDHGFAEDATPIQTGAAREREMIEFERKKLAWKTIKDWSAGHGVEAGEVEKRTQWSLVAYRHTVRTNPLCVFFCNSLIRNEQLHTFDNPPFWNLFNGLLFSNAAGTRWLLVDYHESNREYRAITIQARNGRTKERSNELFGMLLFLGNPPPE